MPPAAEADVRHQWQQRAAGDPVWQRNRHRRALAALFVLSLTTRLLILGITGPVMAPDSYHYLGVSENLIRHGSFLEKDIITGELRPQTLRTPGFPLYGAAFYALFGFTEAAHTALAVSQTILASLLVVLVASLGTRYFSAQVGLLAGLLSALDPWLTYASISVLADTLYSFLFFLCFALGASTLHRPSAWRALAWASLLGVCTLIRPVSEYQILILLTLLLLLSVPLRRRFGLVAIAFCSFGLLIGAWMLRNHTQTGYWDLATHKGRSLLWETVHLTSPSTPKQHQEDPLLARARDIVADTPHTVAEIYAKAPDEGKPHPGQIAFMRLRREMELPEQEADRLMATIAYENLLDHPLAYALRGIRESVLFLTRISMAVDLIWELGIVDTGVTDSLKQRQYFYPMMNLAFRIATATAFVPLLFFGLIKAWRTIPEHRLLHLLFAFTLMYHFLIVGLVVGDDRYRLPLHAMMWLYVSHAAYLLGRRSWLGLLSRYRRAEQIADCGEVPR